MFNQKLKGDSKLFYMPLACHTVKDYYKYKTSSLKKVVSHIVSNWFSWPLIGQTIAFKASSHMKNWFFITKAVFWTSLLTILFE